MNWMNDGIENVNQLADVRSQEEVKRKKESRSEKQKNLPVSFLDFNFKIDTSNHGEAMGNG